MRENNVHGNNTPEEVWISIVTCLKAANDAGTWAFWRERFNTNHPDHVRHQEIENPMRFAEANWHAAKGMYCIHKDEMDILYKSYNHDGNHPHKLQLELFDAMVKVCEKEMSEQLEQQILKEEIVKRDPNLDEDEQYIEEEGMGRWEGDDFLGEEEEESYLLDDEEYVEDFETDDEY